MFRAKPKEYASCIMRLSHLIGNGISVRDAIHMMSEGEGSRSLRESLRRVDQMLAKGIGFSRALSKEGFPKILVNLVSVGEASGTLPRILAMYADSVEREASVLERVKSVFVMPKIVISVGIIGLFVVLKYAIPGFVSIYTGSNVELPLVTRAMVQLSGVATSPIGLPLFGGLVVLLLFSNRIKEGALEKAFLSLIPQARALNYKAEWARWTSSMAVLLKGGVNLSDALAVTAGAVPSSIQKRMKEITAGVLKGRGFVASIKRACTRGEVMPFVVNLLETGEKTGDLGESFAAISRIFQRELEEDTRRLAATVEPAMTVLVAGMVGLLAYAIFSPMITLWQNLMSQM